MKDRVLVIARTSTGRQTIFLAFVGQLKLHTKSHLGVGEDEHGVPCELWPNFDSQMAWYADFTVNTPVLVELQAKKSVISYTGSGISRILWASTLQNVWVISPESLWPDSGSISYVSGERILFPVTEITFLVGDCGIQLSSQIFICCFHLNYVLAFFGQKDHVNYEEYHSLDKRITLIMKNIIKRWTGGSR